VYLSKLYKIFNLIFYFQFVNKKFHRKDIIIIPIFVIMLFNYKFFRYNYIDQKENEKTLLFSIHFLFSFFFLVFIIKKYILHQPKRKMRNKNGLKKII